MTRQLRSVFALLALVIATGACSGGTPTSPTPDPVVDQPPAVSSLELEATIPAPGSTLKATVVLPNGSNSGEEITVNVRYAISAEDLEKVKRDGDTLAIEFCLSIDGDKPVMGQTNRYSGFGVCSGGGAPTSNYSGRVGGTIGLNKGPYYYGYDNVGQTDYLILYMLARHGSGQGQTERVILKKAVPAIFKWL